MNIGSIEKNTQHLSPIAGNKDVHLPVADKKEKEDTNNKISFEIKEIVKKNTSYLKNPDYDLNVRYDDSVDRMIFTVVDKKTGEMIEELPNEIVLNITRSIKEKVDAMFIDQRR